jgi:hypothetical protein
MTRVAVLSDAVNNVVVQVEGRRYPGLVVQGDRLREWRRLAKQGDENSISLLATALDDAVAWYDRVNAEHRGDDPNATPTSTDNDAQTPTSGDDESAPNPGVS